MLLKRFRIPTFAIGLLALASLTLSGTAVQEAQAGNSLNKALGIGLAIGAGALIINELACPQRRGDWLPMSVRFRTN